MKFIRNFMAVFGPVSSIFDFLTFWVMLALLHAGHTEFRTGWFVESIATQTLVVYVIRTRRVPFFKSRPSLPMLLVPTGAALVGAILPYTGLAHLLGFTPLPTAFFLLLFGMVVVYLLLVELAKTRFYRAPHARSLGPHPPTPNGWNGASGAGRPASSATQSEGRRLRGDPSALRLRSFTVGLAEDVLRCLGPGEGVGAVVPAGDEGADLGVEVPDAGEAATVDGLAPDDREPDRPGSSTRRGRRVRCTFTRGWLSSQARTSACLRAA